MAKVVFSQKQRILKHFMSGRKLTQAQARTWNIKSLSSRVRELRKDGVEISSTPFRNQRGRAVVKYHLAGS